MAERKNAPDTINSEPDTAKDKIAVRKFKIKVKDNKSYCGIGAGGVQFAYGEAVIREGVLVNWYREHDGYEVTEVTA